MRIARPMLAGGTEKPGVPAAVFAMPPGMAIRYDEPDAAIRDYITGYHVYSAYGPDVMGQVDWFLPGAANIRITLDNGPVTVGIRNRRFGPLGAAVLFGPTTHVMRAVTNGGTMIGIGISPIAWSRLFRVPAHKVADQIVPLETLLPAARVDALIECLATSDRSHQVKPRLDGFMATLLGPLHRDEALVRQLMALIVDDQVDDLETAADRLGIDRVRLRRLSARHFGVTPKLLFSRARFLRSLLAIMAAEGRPDYARMSARYFDASHFIRDAHTYLGMTPRQFMALDKPFLTASLRARARVLGTATQALHELTGRDATLDAAPPHP